MEKYSQNDEQSYILDYFKDYPTGKFVEIGAFNPKTFSNTRALYEKNFIGVYVEPSRICMENFRVEYNNEPRITLVECAITGHNGKIKFFESNGDAVSTTDIPHKDKWAHGGRVNFSEIEVTAMSMESFLNEYGKDTDFFNLDVEATNMYLFNLVPDWFWSRLKMICIEHDNGQNEIINKLSNYGFKTLMQNGENLIMAK